MNHLTEEARQWLKFHAGIPLETKGEARRAALKAYRKRIASAIKPNDSEPRLWASKILSNAAHGEVVPALALRMAQEALGIKEEDGEVLGGAE